MTETHKIINGHVLTQIGEAIRYAETSDGPSDPYMVACAIERAAPLELKSRVTEEMLSRALIGLQLPDSVLHAMVGAWLAARRGSLIGVATTLRTAATTLIDDGAAIDGCQGT